MYVFLFVDPGETLVDFDWAPYRGVHTPGDGIGQSAGIED